MFHDPAQEISLRQVKTRDVQRHIIIRQTPSQTHQAHTEGQGQGQGETAQTVHKHKQQRTTSNNTNQHKHSTHGIIMSVPRKTRHASRFDHCTPSCLVPGVGAGCCVFLLCMCVLGVLVVCCACVCVCVFPDLIPVIGSNPVLSSCRSNAIHARPSGVHFTHKAHTLSSKHIHTQAAEQESRATTPTCLRPRLPLCSHTCVCAVAASVVVLLVFCLCVCYFFHFCISVDHLFTEIGDGFFP